MSVSKRIHEEGHEAFTGQLDGIYATLPTLKWNHYCHLSKFLASIIRAFPEAEITRYFDYFYEDRKTYDRGKAIQVAHLVWAPDVERKVWEYFLATFDYTSYKLLLERSDFENFASIFKDLWRHEHFPFPQKIELLRRLAVHRFRALGFLKKESPLSYLHAVVLAGKKTLKGTEVLEIALTSTNERELGFSLWCLGKLGYWNELLEMKKKLPGLEQRFRYDKLRGYGIAEEDLAKYNEEYF